MTISQLASSQVHKNRHQSQLDIGWKIKGGRRRSDWAFKNKHCSSRGSGSVPSSHIKWLTTSYSSSRAAGVFWPPWTPCSFTHICAHTCTKPKINIKIKGNFPVTESIKTQIGHLGIWQVVHLIKSRAVTSEALSFCNAEVPQISQQSRPAASSFIEAFVLNKLSTCGFPRAACDSVYAVESVLSPRNMLALSPQELTALDLMFFDISEPGASGHHWMLLTISRLSLTCIWLEVYSCDVLHTVHNRHTAYDS